MCINQQLCGLYKEADRLFEKLLCKGGYSDVFVTGVSDYAPQKRKKLLIVGQEARNWSWDKGEKLSHEERQKYAVDYLNENLELCQTSSACAFNGSAFWEMMRFVYRETEYFPIWANLDKVHTYQNCITTPLQTFEEEKLLLKRCFDGKTLLQKEIELIEPDAVLLVTGPTYYKATNYALGVEKYNKRGDILKENVPRWGEACQVQRISVEDQVPMLWTYHPTYAKRKKKLEDYLLRIREALSSSGS